MSPPRLARCRLINMLVYTQGDEETHTVWWAIRLWVRDRSGSVDYSINAKDSRVEGARLFEPVSTLLSIGGTTYLKDIFDNSKFKVVGMLLEDGFQTVCCFRGADYSPDSVISLQKCVYDPSTKEA